MYTARYESIFSHTSPALNKPYRSQESFFLFELSLEFPLLSFVLIAIYITYYVNTCILYYVRPKQSDEFCICVFLYLNEAIGVVAIKFRLGFKSHVSSNKKIL